MTERMANLVAYGAAAGFAFLLAYVGHVLPQYLPIRLTNPTERVVFSGQPGELESAVEAAHVKAVFLPEKYMHLFGESPVEKVPVQVYGPPDWVVPTWTTKLDPNIANDMIKFLGLVIPEDPLAHIKGLYPASSGPKVFYSCTDKPPSISLHLTMNGKDEDIKRLIADAASSLQKRGLEVTGGFGEYYIGTECIDTSDLRFPGNLRVKLFSTHGTLILHKGPINYSELNYLIELK